MLIGLTRPNRIVSQSSSVHLSGPVILIVIPEEIDITRALKKLVSGTVSFDGPNRFRADLRGTRVCRKSVVQVFEPADVSLSNARTESLFNG